MNIKRFVVDAVALNIFLLVISFVIVVIVSGISLPIFWLDRLIMFVPNIIIVEPYNRVRSWIGTKLGVWKSQRLHKILRDTFSFVICRVPLVFIVLPLLGAPMNRVISAAAFATLISGFTGSPYGIFLDKTRRLFGV